MSESVKVADDSPTIGTRRTRRSRKDMPKKTKSKKAPKSNKPFERRRRGTQTEQEKLSRYQLAIAWNEWPLQSSAEDLGEDLLFQIYANGQSTGLSLYVQLKSTTNLEALRSTVDGRYVNYRLETKDLLHWENSIPSVAVVVWDVQTRKGVWLDVPAALADLDARVPRWRKQRKATIRIPRTHKTDAKGRDALRATIATLAMPMLSAGKEMKISHRFSFPQNKEGRAAFEELRRFVDEGGSATVPSKFIKEFRMSDWWERAAGTRIPEHLTFSSRGDGLPLKVEVQVVGPSRTDAIVVPLQRTQVGRKQATFSTNDPGGPVSLTLTMARAPKDQLAISVKMTFQHPCRSIHDSLLITKLLIGVRQGGTVQLVLPGRAPMPQPNFAIKGGRDLEELIRWERALQMLSYIQSRVASFGTFDVEQLKGEDLPAIRRLFTILETGELDGSMSFTATLRGRQLHGPFELGGDGGAIELLGVTVPLGQVRFVPKDQQQLVDVVGQGSGSGRQQDQITVKDVPVTQRFVEWGPKGTGPGATAPSPRAGRRRARK